MALCDTVMLRKACETSRSSLNLQTRYAEIYNRLHHVFIASFCLSSFIVHTLDNTSETMSPHTTDSRWVLDKWLQTPICITYIKVQYSSIETGSTSVCGHDIRHTGWIWWSHFGILAWTMNFTLFRTECFRNCDGKPSFTSTTSTPAAWVTRCFSRSIHPCDSTI